MSGDEVFATLFCSILSLVGWGLWYAAVLQVRACSAARPRRGLLALMPLVCGISLLAVLRTLASADVVDAPPYLFMYTAMGMAWVTVFGRATSLLGLGYRFDVLERNNGAAAIVVAAALLSLTACFAGGNVGDGPGWWVVVFCA